MGSDQHPAGEGGARVGQWVVGGGRFVGEHVQGHAAQVAGAQAGQQRGLVNEAAAGEVDQDGVRGQAGQEGGVDQLAGGRGQRAVQADDVRSGQQLGQVDPAFAGRAPRNGCRGHLHQEAARDAGHGAADGPQADDDHPLAGQLEQRLAEEAEVGRAGPVARLHRCVVGGDVVGEVQGGGEHRLGDGLGPVSGDVGDGDAALAGGVQVHHVGARGAHADVTELWQLAQSVGVQDHLVGDERLGAGGALEHLVGAGARVDDQLPELG